MLGSDFESFIQIDGKIEISPREMKMPTKGQEPIQLFSDQGEEVGSFHRDNVMLEVCSIPAATAKDMVTNIQKARQAADAWVADRSYYGCLSHKPSHRFTNGEARHPNANELGCDADFVSKDFDSLRRDPMKASDLGVLRCSGAHIHISYEEEMLPAWLAACICDLFIGLPNSRYLDRRRAKFYGNLTLHRPTRYPDDTTGVEYRPLDNFWIHNIKRCKDVASGAEKVQDVLNAKDQDLIQELFRMHTNLPKAQLLCELVDNTEASYQVKEAHNLWKDACG